jgi:malonyl CoA-acyl carrier protein transacylase/NADP-dependent 3-hydroxy acid dehydrogenase YdfG
MPLLKARIADEQPDLAEGWSCPDVYGDSYFMPSIPYEGVDFSRKCFVFPGQSAAQPGMGAADLQRFEVLQKRFAIADALAASRDIPVPSLYITDPSQISSDKESLVQCLALFTMSVGLFELLLLHNERPALVTGHSFGEYAALVASGIASFEDIFDLICARDQVCPPARKTGSMIAVSANAQDVRRVLKGTAASIANQNSPQQTVLSVPADAVTPMIAALKREKLAALVLEAIPQPYHSSMLDKAAVQLAQYVRDKNPTFRPPQIPMLSSVSGALIKVENFSVANIRDLISKQLTAPVDFIAQIHTAATTAGCRHFIELAHVKNCTPWIMAIMQGESCKISVPSVLASAPAAATLRNPGRPYDSKMVGFLNRVISSVTGYSIEEISLANNFQEDLGIDSIKKAQIVFNFLEGQGDFSIDTEDNAVMNQIRTVEDVLAWFTKDKGSEGKRAAESSAFLRHRAEWIEEDVSSVDKLLAQPAMSCVWLPLARVGELSGILETAENGGIVFYDDGSPFVFEDFLAPIQAAYAKIKSLPPYFAVALVIQNSASVEIQALDGFFKSLALETGFLFRTLRFDQFSKERDAARVEEEITLPFIHSIRFVNGKRQVLKSVPCSKPSTSAPIPETVFAIGGATGITREIVKDLISRGTKNVYIVGRSEAENEKVQSGLQDLRTFGAQVVYEKGDATQRDTLERLLKGIAQKHGAIDLLIHGGGMENSALANQQSPAAVRAQIAIKVDTVRHLVDLSGALPIKKIVCFSSTAGEFGNAGQTVYAYANMAMTFICQQAKDAGRPFQVIAWPAWHKVGMTENENIHRQMLLGGVRFLDVPTGCRLFVETLADAATVRTVCFNTRGIANKNGDPVSPKALQSIFPALQTVEAPIHLKHWTLQGFPDLRDHVVLDQMVVPATLCVAAFLYLGYFETGKACKLVDLKTSSFMPVHQKDSPYFLDYHWAGNRLQAEIRSNESHIATVIEPCSASEMPTIPFVLPPDTQPLNMDNIDYDDCRKSFRVNRAAVKGTGGYTYAELDCAHQKIHLGSDPVHLIATLIEGMFQLAGMGVRALTNKSSVPLAIKTLAINSAARPTPMFKIMAHCTVVSDNLCSNELYAYNADGVIFIHISGEQVRTWMPDEA